MRGVQAVLLIVSVTGCVQQYDLRRNGLEVGDIIEDEQHYELHGGKVTFPGFVGRADLDVRQRGRTLITQVDLGEVIEVEEWIDTATIDVDQVGFEPKREISPFQGLHARGFRHRGIWERSLASGKLKLHQKYLLEAVTNALGWDLLPAEPLEIGETYHLGPLQLAGAFGMPLYAQVEGRGALTLDTVQDGVAKVRVLISAKIQHSGLGAFTVSLAGWAEADLEHGFMRAYDLAGHAEMPLRQLGVEGKIVGPWRSTGKMALKPSEG